MATINLTEEEYEGWKRKVREADDRGAELKQALEAAQAKPLETVYADLAEAYNAAKVCVDFMVGNLHPEFIKSMPWEALETLANRVAQVGGNGERDIERAMIWTEHVRIIKKFELERQLRGGDPEPNTFRRDKPV